MKCMKCRANDPIPNSGYCSVCQQYRSIDLSLGNYYTNCVKCGKQFYNPTRWSTCPECFMKEEKNESDVERRVATLEGEILRLKEKAWEKEKKYNDKGGKIHKCTIDLDDIKIEGDMGGWLFTDLNENYSVYVKFCPFCGVNFNEL